MPMKRRSDEEIAEGVRRRRQEERDAGRLPDTVITPRMLAALSRIVASSLPRRTKKAS